MSSKFKLVLKPSFISKQQAESPKRGRGRPKKIVDPNLPVEPKRPRGRPKGGKSTKSRREKNAEQKEIASDLIEDINDLNVQLMEVKKRIRDIVPTAKIYQDRSGRPYKYNTIEEMRQQWRENYYIKKAKMGGTPSE